jgi:15-cis-phytoene synthase
MSIDALASFEAKWALAHPELPLALRFAQIPVRPLLAAFACLSLELGHAAFHIAEPDVATTKLRWWSEELSGLPSGRVRHPLTGLLAEHASRQGLAGSAWIAVMAGAFHQRESAPPSTLDELLTSYRRYYLPLAEIEAGLFKGLNACNVARAAVLSRALNEVIRVPETLARDRLPLPLDLLARHQLSRGELGQAGGRRSEALREHLETLAQAMQAADRQGLSPLLCIRLHADQLRCRRAAKAVDPLAESARGLDRLPLSSAWIGWRAARRLQPSR